MTLPFGATFVMVTAFGLSACGATEHEASGPRAQKGAASGSPATPAVGAPEGATTEKIADLSKGPPADDETVIDPVTGEKIPPLTAEELKLIDTPPAELSKEDRVKRSRALRKKVLRNPNSETAKSLRDASAEIKGQLEKQAQGESGGADSTTLRPQGQ